MNISKELLARLQKLSSLSIDPSREEHTIENLNQIVNFVEVLNELDLQNEESSFVIQGGGTPLREDLPLRDELVIQTILKNAPKIEENFFVAPKIIE